MWTNFNSFSKKFLAQYLQACDLLPHEWAHVRKKKEKNSNL